MFKNSTTESEQECHVLQLEGSCDFNVRSHTPQFLQYLDASRWMDRAELLRRRRGAGLPIPEKEALLMEGQCLGSDLTVVKQCVDNGFVTFKANLICEGLLARGLVGAESLEYAYGYAEAWLCVASRVLDYSDWQGVWQLLALLYQHMVLIRAGQTRGSLSPSHGGELNPWEERGRKLFTVLCGAVDSARSGLGRGAYVLRDEDVRRSGIVCLSSGKSSTGRSEGGEGVLFKVRLMYDTDEARLHFPLDNDE